MDYKRLTDKDWHNEKFYGHSDCERTILKRLWDLENKIENGTLVDTEEYFIVQENQWAGKNRFLICKNGVQLETYDFCETREEAEKRLEELQNG